MNLLDKEENVNQGTIVFEAFGGKIIVIVRNIYMNICKNTIQITIMFGHLKPDKSVIPGNAKK